MAITAPVTSRGKGGFRSCTFRRADGRTFDCTIIAPGSTSGYKIVVTTRRSIPLPSVVTLDNIPLATSLKGAVAAIQPRIS